MRPNFSKTFELSKKQFRLLYNEFKSRNKGSYPVKDMPKFKDLWETHSNGDTIVLDVETRRHLDCLFFVGLDDDHFLTEFLKDLN